MEEETVRGINLGTSLILMGALLTFTLIVLFFARMYGNKFFETVSAQNEKSSMVGLDSLEVSGTLDIPVAAVYAVVAKEWRAVEEIDIFNKDGNLVTSAMIEGNVWKLSVPVQKLDGTEVTKITIPEAVLYVGSDGIYANTLRGRAYVQVKQSVSTKAYTIQLKLQD